MRLLDTSTYQLVEVESDDALPDYATLSHIWGRKEEGVTYQDIISDDEKVKLKAGYTKIQRYSKSSALHALAIHRS